MTPAIFTTKHLLIIGAVHLDDIAKPDGSLVPEASNPVKWVQRIGGVASNAACAAAKILIPTTKNQLDIVAAVGDDATASVLKQTLQAAGVGTRFIEFPGASTGRYTAIMTHKGELHIGLSDVSLAERLGESKDHASIGMDPDQAVLVDANLSERYLKMIAEQTTLHNSSLTAMSVSPVKSLRLLPIANKVDLLFCNRREALSMAPHLHTDTSLSQLGDALQLAGFTQFVLTDGSSPLLIQGTSNRVSLAVPQIESTKNVNGAGDALAGASFAAWANGMDLVKAVQEIGLPQAAMIVRGDHNAPLINSAAKPKSCVD